MQPSCPVQGCCQTLGMSESPGLVQRPLTLLHSLLRIAPAPERVGQNGSASHARRLAIPERLGALHRDVNEGNPLLEVFLGGGVVAQEERGAPERVIGL